MSDQVTSIGQVLGFVNSFHERCRNMIRDTVRMLREESSIYLQRNYKMEYCDKPNDRFLDQECSMVRRSWCVYVPTNEIRRAALFYIEFCHPHRYVTPALIYGAMSYGDADFSAVERWAAHKLIIETEKRDPSVTVTFNDPITIVTGAMPLRFEEAACVRVPLESIADEAALKRIVVAPLSALLRGSQAEAASLLSGVQTEHWPSATSAAVDEDETDPEQA